MENNQINDDIYNILTKKGYNVEKNPIDKGAVAKIYPAKKDNKEYMIRVKSLDSDHEVREKRIINDNLSYQNCDESGFCNKKCIPNIACSEYTLTISDNLVEIMKKYNGGSLWKYIVNEIDDGKIIKYEDKNSFYKLSLEDPKYLTIFNTIVRKLWIAIKTLHDKDMAHGDIKPENILIDVSNNNISDIALADFDTLCIGKKSDNSYLCSPSDFTLLYTTYNLWKLNKGSNEYNISYKKINDIYAIVLVILIIWYGFNGFFNNFGDFYNNKNFESEFIELSNPTPNQETVKKRDKFFKKLEIWNDSQLSQLNKKYKINPELINASGYIYSAIETLKQVMYGKPVHVQLPKSPRNVQSGGNSMYYSKYIKYKKKYLDLAKSK